MASAFERLFSDGGRQFVAEPYAPIERTSAHRHTNLGPGQVLDTNVIEILMKWDGLIVHRWHPGASVGQEFAWSYSSADLSLLWVHMTWTPSSTSTSSGRQPRTTTACSSLSWHRRVRADPPGRPAGVIVPRPAGHNAPRSRASEVY